MVSHPAPLGRGPRPHRAVLFFFCLILVGCASESLAKLQEGSVEPGGRQAPESYVLPITPPLDQGDSDLCWVYAALSMLESNYLYRHPGSKISLSRGALQRDSIADRFARLIRGERSPLEDGGLAVEALALIRRDGLVARGDFHHVVDSGPIYASIKRRLARTASPAGKRSIVQRQLEARLGREPPLTHLDGQALSPRQLAEAVLGGHAWTEFDRSRRSQSWGLSRDPDARSDTRVRYVGLGQMIDLIHRSLAEGEAVAAGTPDHAFLIYGADYDRDGKPMSYLIKDSLAPHLYRESAESVHRTLHDVTVAR